MTGHNPKKNSPFFVGYLPMPAALQRFYWPLAVLLIAAAGFAGYQLAAGQKSTGPATWDLSAANEVRGVLTLTPYPAVHRFHRDRPGEIQSILLVQPGKHAADAGGAIPADFDRQAVLVAGYPIQRGEWQMLEMTSPVGQAVKKIAQADNENTAALLSSLTVASLGAVSINGEIADSKCILGVMKPGAGHIHKACAEVCLRGGIPPLLVARYGGEQKFGYLIATADGGNASRMLADYAAEPVRVSGQLQQQGNLLYIRMNDDGVTRL